MGFSVRKCLLLSTRSSLMPFNYLTHFNLARSSASERERESEKEKKKRDNLLKG